MMHSTQSLYDSARECAVQIERQIEAVVKRAERRLPVHETPGPDFIYTMLDINGKPVLQDLLLAKANALNAMAVLKAATVKAR